MYNPPLPPYNNNFAKHSDDQKYPVSCLVPRHRFERENRGRGAWWLVGEARSSSSRLLQSRIPMRTALKQGATPWDEAAQEVCFVNPYSCCCPESDQHTISSYSKYQRKVKQGHKNWGTDHKIWFANQLFLPARTIGNVFWPVRRICMLNSVLKKGWTWF